MSHYEERGTRRFIVKGMIAEVSLGPLMILVAMLNRLATVIRNDGVLFH